MSAGMPRAFLSVANGLTCRSIMHRSIRSHTTNYSPIDLHVLSPTR